MLKYPPRNLDKTGSPHVLRSRHPHDESFFLCLLLLTRSSGQNQATAASAGFPFPHSLAPQQRPHRPNGKSSHRPHIPFHWPRAEPLCGGQWCLSDGVTAMFSLSFFFRTMSRRRERERERRVWTLQTYKIGDINIRIG